MLAPSRVRVRSQARGRCAGLGAGEGAVPPGRGGGRPGGRPGVRQRGQPRSFPLTTRAERRAGPRRQSPAAAAAGRAEPGTAGPTAAGRANAGSRCGGRPWPGRGSRRCPWIVPDSQVTVEGLLAGLDGTLGRGRPAQVTHCSSGPCLLPAATPNGLWGKDGPAGFRTARHSGVRGCEARGAGFPLPSPAPPPAPRKVAAPRAPRGWRRSRGCPLVAGRRCASVRG